MIDALQLVVVQLALVVLVAAVAGGVLGWLLGRAGKRQVSEKPAAGETSASFDERPQALYTEPTSFVPKSPQEPSRDVQTVLTQREADADEKVLAEWAVTEPERDLKSEARISELEHKLARQQELAVKAKARMTQLKERCVRAEQQAQASSAEAEAKFAELEQRHEVSRQEAAAEAEAKLAELEQRHEVSRQEAAAEAEAKLAELKALADRHERELSRLEMGATVAWDTTVPSLEKTIEQLRHDNSELRGALVAAQAELESTRHELELVQKSRNSKPRTETT